MLNRIAIFLTLILVLSPFQNLYAATDYSDYTDTYTSELARPDRPALSPLADDDRQHRLNLLLDYVRKEGPAYAPGLPSALLHPENWALGGLSNLGAGRRGRLTAARKASSAPSCSRSPP